jgi:tripartite-type tricarboxylate transporter receptor subunit TctC
MLQLMLSVALAIVAVTTARAEDFYAGKTISISTFVPPGGNYDSYIRLLARYMPRYIPGHPTMIAVNQTGAGGLVAINHAGRVAPQDGTFLTLASQGLLLLEATGGEGLHVSLGAFKWLGNISRSNNVTVTWYKTGLASIEGARAREYTVGASGAGSISAQFPSVFNALLGTRFHTILGYEGGSAINLALRRGEVDVRGMDTWVGYKQSFGPEIAAGQLRPLMQIGLSRDPELPQVPLLTDLVRDDPPKLAVAQFLTEALALSRPVAAAPGTPADRVAILRQAFDATMRDPELIAEARRESLEIDPMAGGEVQAAVARILATPAETVAAAKAALDGHAQGP